MSGVVMVETFELERDPMNMWFLMWARIQLLNYTVITACIYSIEMFLVVLGIFPGT